MNDFSICVNQRYKGTQCDKFPYFEMGIWQKEPVSWFPDSLVDWFIFQIGRCCVESGLSQYDYKTLCNWVWWVMKGS